MAQKTSPDLKMWIEQLMAIHLRNHIPLNEIRTTFIGRAIAQILDYWRFKIPEKWNFAIVDNNFVNYGYLVAEHQKTLSSAALDCDHYVENMYTTLENGDWQSMLDMPEPVWEILSMYTGLSKSKWEAIVDLTDELLETKVSCPDCASVFKVREAGVPDKIDEPFSMSSAHSLLRFHCPRCTNPMIYDAVKQDMQQPSATRSVIHGIPLAFIISVIAAIIMWLLWRSL